MPMPSALEFAATLGLVCEDTCPTSSSWAATGAASAMDRAASATAGARTSTRDSLAFMVLPQERPVLAQQLSARPDDGQVDVAPALALLGRVVDVHAAEIELAHVGDRLEHLLARGLGARA